MDADYFRSLAKRCFSAAHNCFGLHAKGEFRTLGDELTQKADELDGVIPLRRRFRLVVNLRETVMAIRQSSKRSNRSVTLLIGAFCAVTALVAPTLARAEGFFDFLLGIFQDHPSPGPQPQNGYPSAPQSGVGRIAPGPLGQESVNDAGGSTGHAVAFCVRLCDGYNFPMEQMINGTPGETCRTTCPYSRTKVFFGNEIGVAIAQDGQRYTALDAAFLYRKQLVAECTCNGRDAFGLSTFDVKRDPTLRPGDIVSTKEGLLAYTGRASEGAAFTPVNPAMLPADIRPIYSQPRPSLADKHR